MEHNLRELATSVNGELANLKVLIATAETQLKKNESVESVQLTLNGIRTKIDDMSTGLFKYLQTDRAFNIKQFLLTNIDEVSANGKIHYKVMGNQDFTINTSERKLLTFFKILSLHAQRVNAKIIQIHQTKNYIIIKDNGEEIDDSILKKIVSPKLINDNDEHLAIFVSLKKFCTIHNMDFDFCKQITGQGHVMTIKKREKSS